MVSLAVAKLMRRPSKAPTVALFRGGWPCNIHEHSCFNTTPIFGFIPLSVVFDLDAEQLTLLILSAAPVFSVGLAEDLGYDMSPKARLIASAASNLVAILLFKVWLDGLGIPGVDMLLMFAPIGILFTVFATVGVVNALNLIDGLNGLSSTVSVSGRFTINHCVPN